mmetsp:Transcript_68561/g.155369  ORF Transcript_68561/g.155369 Transcript_68561/m.155369 type:complete len:203 (+) Transcript_68561:410-1018(+)
MLVLAQLHEDATEPVEEAAQHGSRAHGMLHVVHVDGPDGVVLVLRQHANQAHVPGPPVLPGEVQEELPLVSVIPAGNVRGHGLKVSCVHAWRVHGYRPLEVAVGPLAQHLLDTVELVHTEVTNQSQGLDDIVHVLKLPTFGQHDRSKLHSLHGVLDVLHLAVGACQEDDVADAKAAALADGHGLARAVSMDGVEAEGVRQSR